MPTTLPTPFASFAIAWFVFGGIAFADETVSESLFVRRIVPLIHEKCLACHGKDEDNIEGGLDMRSRQAVLRGGDSDTPSLVIGRPDDSPIYLAATRDHNDWSAMPPKDSDRLYAEQLDWLKQWIETGAAWPDENRRDEIASQNASAWEAEDGVIVATSGGLAPEWTNRRYQPEDLWAYQPVIKPDVPAGNPIDALIAKRMPDGLTVAGDADAKTLIRRATFDLTGLPPSPNEVTAFAKAYAADPDDAMRLLVERLLASPHYGERMAQHWLDVVRYADSSGFANDYERGNAWRYRDYVVRSFNDDLPYDEFVRQQIAGDEIDPGNAEMIVATGFLRMGPWELTGMEVARVARQRFLDDVTNGVGETFLAHSLQCARCHDHKFDPVPTQDYYSIQAVFATTQLSERRADFLDNENVSGFDEQKYLYATMQQHLMALRSLDQKLLDNAAAWYAKQDLDAAAWNKAVADAKAFVESGNKTQSKRSFTGVFDIARSTIAKTKVDKKKITEDQYPPKLVGFTPEDFGNERVARKGLERLKWALERYEPFALAVYNGRTPQMTSVNQPLRMPANRMDVGELEASCVRVNGDPFAVGQSVTPGVLSVLDGQLPPSDFPLTKDIEGRRRGLADWIADPRNPLTTRAIVNRIWLWHFGQPLAGNPNNFGGTGKKPSHPELLDFLAAELVQQGYSIKAMHRQIMNSKAYRRSATHPNLDKLREADSEGISYAVFWPRRLTAEELRDAMLTATGELNPTLGGIPNRPEMNLEAALQPRQVMGTFASAWVPNPLPSQRHRRSIYAMKIRGLPDPSMEVFNQPTPDFSCERRDASTVTPQVFSLFNGQAIHSRSLALADRVAKECDDDAAMIRRCFQLCLSRGPSPEELQSCLEHWQDIEAMIATEKLSSVSPPLEITRQAVEENTGEKFTFQETLQAYADFVPDLQPADVPLHVRALADVCLVLLNCNEFAYVY